MDDIAKKLITEELGFEAPRVQGYHLAIKIFIREKMNEDSVIELSSKTQEHDKYSSNVGKVLSIGPEAYDPKNFPSGPRCKIGDWVCFKIGTGTRVNYRGIVVEFMPDVSILCPIDSPEFVTRC